jgi:lantibiotic modifying enzyme
MSSSAIKVRSRNAVHAANPGAILRATVVEIGRALCAGAYWDTAGRECNWMGHRDVEDALSAPYSERNAALSPELYSGTAGVGWFLAEVHGVTGDRLAGETARGALRRSIRYLREFPSPAYPLSLYAGHLGLLYAAVRLAEIDPALALHDECEQLFAHLERERHAPHPYDIIGGNAGAILALLEIAGRFRPQACRDLAAELGDELCEAATWSGATCCWQASGGFAKLPPMTGFSHGASGIATSLLHLHDATGDARLLRTARGAFAFEDSLYSASEKNWVDTRYPHHRQDGVATGRFRLSWCHGAPGIAMARAVASRLDTEHAEHHARLARAAAETTWKALDATAAQAEHDATLCHGVAGLSEVLLVVREVLGGDDHPDRAAAILAALAQRHGGWDQWPSGLQSRGKSPCLMVGAAGIGLHVLRLVHPGAAPSPLLPGWRHGGPG